MLLAGHAFQRRLSRLFRHAARPVPSCQAVAAEVADVNVLKNLIHDEAEHRLANLLQVVASNLDQAARSLDGPARMALDAASGQLCTLGRLQQQLAGHQHRTETCEKQINALAATLNTLMLCPRGHTLTASVEPELAPVLLTADVAQCLSLVVVEIVINAAKHAFLDGPGGRVELKLKGDTTHLACSIVDDGNGGVGGSIRAGSRGMTLINALVSQAGGRCQWVFSRTGTSVLVTLPIENCRPETGGPVHFRNRHAQAEIPA